MKKKRARLNYKGKNFDISLRVCGKFKRFSGLMFTPREKARALLFEFKKPVNMPIHSFFVFFPFVVVWLDHENKIIDLKVVDKFRFSILPTRPFCKMVEIPLNRRYSRIMSFLVGHRKV